MQHSFIAALVSTILTVSAPVAIATPGEVRFETADGVTVFADLHLASPDMDGPFVLLFHQGGSNARGEYGDFIAPRLVEAGYHVLTVDQRLGGTRHGSHNRTVDRLTERAPADDDQQQYGYCDALPDLDAAVTFIRRRGFTGRLAVWGSSYSAALVFHLAAQRPTEIDAVLGFSPAGGGPVGPCVASQVIDNVKAPAFVARPRSEMERAASWEQAERLAGAGAWFVVSPGGVHGSSMLHPDRSSGVEPMWGAVLAFLDSALRPAEPTD